MSQVKNLRAMFENKGDTSPPDRGRSSGASTPVQGTNGTESPRPLSKVRTNFVAIEKDGRIGLQRDPSHESSVSRRRLSMETDAESVSTVPDKPSASLDDVTRGSKPFVQEPVPESSHQTIESSKVLQEEIGAVTDEPSVNPDKKIDEEESSVLLPAEPIIASTTKETKPTPAPSAVNGQSKAQTTKEPAPPTPAKAPAPKKTTTTRPAAASTKPSAIKPVAKPTPATRPSTSTAHKSDPKPATKASAPVKKETRP
ncbi:hypothetical protein F66182_10646, partial [Fusarium sp. NRRL 66182]